MSKKIIALSLALMLIVTCFVACGKKYETTKINGEEVILVTDENGNPIINEKNEVVVLVTDRAGEVLTYANGEDQTRYISLQNALEIKGVAYGEHYKMNVLDGWTIGNGDKLIKDKTDGKCYIQFLDVHTLGMNEKFDEVFAETDKANEDIQKAFEDEAKMKELIKTNPDIAKYEGCKYTIDTQETTFTSKAFPCKKYIHKIVDADGDVVHYVNNYYFLVSKTIYNVSYTCVDGVGYDAEFDFDAYLRTNFTFVD